MPGRRALAAQGRMQPEARMKPGRNRPDRMPLCPGMRGLRRPRRKAGRNGTKNQRRTAPCAGAWPGFPGMRQGPAPPKGNPANVQEPQRTVSRLRCRTWFPRSGIRMRPSGFPPKAGLHTGRRDRRPFACACQVSAEARITRTPGKMAAPCTGGAARAPPIRNSLSVQEARRCAAARHSAFSSTATVHPPGQGPER